jgi:hypothetical protein
MRRFSLDESPFATLGVSPRADLATIEDAYEDVLVDHPHREAELLKAKQALLTPNARLVEELAWPTDAAPRRIQDILRKLRAGEAALARAALVDLPPLAAANLAADAAVRFVDESGLRPWWVLDGAEITRHVFERPFGRDIARFAQLREQRLIYRLALGQPNQEDFLDVISRGGEQTRQLLQTLVLDLSAMGLRHRPETDMDADTVWHAQQELCRRI